MTERPKLLPAFVLASCLAVGFGLVWAICYAWTGQAAFIWLRLPWAAEKIVVTAKGKPLIQYYENRDSHKERYRDLDGDPVTVRFGDGWTQAQATVQPPAGKPPFVWECDWAQRIRIFQGPEKTYWHFVHDGKRNGTGYFVGFDTKRDNLRIGFIGTGGFRQTMVPQQERFPVDGMKFRDSVAIRGYMRGNLSYEYGFYEFRSVKPESPETLPAWCVYLASGSRVYEIDLLQQSGRLLLETNEPIESANYYYDREFRQLFLMVRFADRVALIDRKGQQLFSAAIPANLRRSQLQWYECPGGERLMVASTALNDGTRRTREYLLWHNEKGQLLRSGELVIQGKAPKVGGIYAPQLELLACPVAGLLDVMIGIIDPLFRLHRGDASSYGAALGQACSRIWPALLGIHLLSALLAAWCFARERRFHTSLGHRYVWTAFVFIGGLPGVVGYLFHRHWPVLEACPTCAATVPQDRPHCASCQASFPQPSLRGTEVFA